MKREKQQHISLPVSISPANHTSSRKQEVPDSHREHIRRQKEKEERTTATHRRGSDSFSYVFFLF